MRSGWVYQRNEELSRSERTGEEEVCTDFSELPFVTQNWSSGTQAMFACQRQGTFYTMDQTWKHNKSVRNGFVT